VLRDTPSISGAAPAAATAGYRATTGNALHTPGMGQAAVNPASKGKGTNKIGPAAPA
jgi:hypothetical protein